MAIILGSGSAIRAEILRQAGVSFEVIKPNLDEAVIKDTMAAEGASGEDVAQALADAKAVEVSARVDGLVIGADQVLRLDGVLLDKVSSMEEARARLSAMRGKTHELIGGVALAQGDGILERHGVVSRIHVREFSDAFLDAYMEQAGPSILSSVACYQFEGLGAQLFDRIEGDYHAILGMPLVPVLGFLRRHGALPS